MVLGINLLCDSAVNTLDPRSVAHGGIRQVVNNSSDTVLDEFQMMSCRCKEEQFSTCGPDLCNCLQNSQGDITSCLDEVNTLCEDTVTNNGIEPPPTLTMDQCTGSKIASASYCAVIPCTLGGGSFDSARVIYLIISVLRQVIPCMNFPRAWFPPAVKVKLMTQAG